MHENGEKKFVPEDNLHPQEEVSSIDTAQSPEAIRGVLRYNEINRIQGMLAHEPGANFTHSKKFEEAQQILEASGFKAFEDGDGKISYVDYARQVEEHFASLRGEEKEKLLDAVGGPEGLVDLRERYISDQERVTALRSTEIPNQQRAVSTALEQAAQAEMSLERIQSDRKKNENVYSEAMQNLIQNPDLASFIFRFAAKGEGQISDPRVDRDRVNSLRLEIAKNKERQTEIREELRRLGKEPAFYRLGARKEWQRNMQRLNEELNGTVDNPGLVGLSEAMSRQVEEEIEVLQQRDRKLKEQVGPLRGLLELARNQVASGREAAIQANGREARLTTDGILRQVFQKMNQELDKEMKTLTPLKEAGRIAQEKMAQLEQELRNLEEVQSKRRDVLNVVG